jgi:serine/threonine protein kinase
LLKGKPVQVRKLVDIATHVAEGLAAAHTAGVVHRDLKPENIMLAKDGRVKILDFGLARQARTTRPSVIASDQEETSLPDAEATQNLTSEGAVLGTANYMSPEQALGHELDYRSDQFSFGLILYELASGRRAFVKASSIETMCRFSFTCRNCGYGAHVYSLTYINSLTSRTGRIESKAWIYVAIAIQVLVRLGSLDGKTHPQWFYKLRHFSTGYGTFLQV